MSGGAGPTETAVIVAVPEAEDVVGDQRRELDGSAAWGVPAHVTVLYPFVPPDRLDPGAVGRLRATVGSVAAFDCTFRRCGWFGEDVVWLAPEPAQPFRDLTMAVWSQFPDHPPYRGEYPDLAPHLTVGDIRFGSVERLREAAAVVEGRLPVTARIAQARLMAGGSEADSWHTVAVLPLGGQERLSAPAPGHG